MLYDGLGLLLTHPCFLPASLLVRAPRSERLRTGWRAVQLSAEDSAAGIELDDAQLVASSSAGYRMVRPGGTCGALLWPLLLSGCR